MGKTRDSANLVSDINIFVDIANDRVGVGKNNPATKLDVNGVITCTDINSTSDINLKTNLTAIDNAMEKLSTLKGVKFDWKETKESSIGIIAQDLEKVFPELVRSAGDHKTVNYNGLIGVLIEAIKGQQEEINSLKEEIKKLN